MNISRLAKNYCYKEILINLRKKIFKYRKEKWIFIKKKLPKKLLRFKIKKKKFLKKKFFKKKNFKFLCRKKKYRIHPKIKLYRKRKLKFFYNITLFKPTCQFKFIERAKKMFKYNLLAKKKFIYYFNCIFSFKKYKRNLKFNKTRNILINNFFIYPEYRLINILWKIGFFLNPYIANTQIKKGIIFLNGKKTFSNKYVKAGDIVHCYNLKRIFFKNVKKKYIFPIKLYFPFLHVDYYTKTFVIIHDAANIKNTSWNNSINLGFPIQKLKNYFL